MNFLVYLGPRNDRLENGRKDLVSKSKKLFLENGQKTENDDFQNWSVR